MLHYVYKRGSLEGTIYIKNQSISRIVLLRGFHIFLEFWCMYIFCSRPGKGKQN